MTWDCKWSFNYENINIFLYADWVGTGIFQLLRDTDRGSDRILANSTRSSAKFPARIGEQGKGGGQGSGSYIVISQISH